MTAPTATICEIQLRFGGHTQIDVQLPASTELSAVLADLEPYLRAYLDNAGVQEPLPDATRGWRLRTPLGTLLDNGRSLTAQDVMSGTALELISEPVGEHFTPRIESVSSAVAKVSAETFRAATPASVATMMVWYGAAVIAVVLALMTAATFAHHDWLHRGALAGAVSVLAVIAAVNARTRRWAPLTDATTVVLLAFAPLCVSLLIPIPDTGWGPPHLLVTAGGVAAGAVVAIAAGRYVVAYTALAVVALFVAASQIGRLVGLWPGPGMLCVLVIAVVVMLGRVDATAQKLARLPISMFPSGSGRFVGGRSGEVVDSDELVPTSVPPDPAALHDRTIRANDYLTGLLIGYAMTVTALVGLVIATYPDRWTWVLWVAGVPVIFAYQAWYLAGRRNVAAMLLGVFGPVAVAAALFGTYYGLWWGVALGLVVVLLGVLSPRAIPTESRPQSPLIRGIRAVAGYLVILAVILAPLLLLRIVQMVYNRDFGG